MWAVHLPELGLDVPTLASNVGVRLVLVSVGVPVVHELFSLA